MTTAPQLGQRAAATEKTIGEEKTLPNTRLPDGNACQNRRRHPRGFSGCQIAPEQ